jgi:NAD(P)-dependent dehydrogenase (short-subunit alcohol dehydrogenase family)
MKGTAVNSQKEEKLKLLLSIVIRGEGMRLKGIAAIVTGGSSGIGRAISYELAKEGANVIIAALRNIDRANDTAKELKKIGSKTLVLQADITKNESVKKMVSKAIHYYGKIDLLVNNAGLGSSTPLEKISLNTWKKVINVNLHGTFLCSVAVAKFMAKQLKGNIINIIGSSGHRCYAGGGAFGPSKSAVINLTKQMSVEWAKYNIRVNGVSPGPIITEESKSLFEKEEIKNRILRIPLARAGNPEEIAKAVTFLASEDSDYVTGQIIIVDGGSVNTWYLNP